MTSLCSRTPERRSRRRLWSVESEGTLTNNTEIFHSSISKMEDKSDNDSGPCEDGLSNKLSVRKRRSTRRTSYRSATVGRRTTMTAPSDRAKSSNPDSCEEEKLDGRDGFSAKLGNVKVKEEYVSSGEEENVSSWQGEVSFRGREAEVSSGEEENVSSGEEENVSSGQGEVSFRGGEEEVTFKEGEEEEVSFKGGEEEVSSGEEDDVSSGEEENVSSGEEVTFRGGEEEVTFKEGEEEVTFKEGEEEVTFKEGEEVVSFRGGEEEVSFRGGEEEVSFSAGDTSSRKKGLRNIKPVQNSTGTQHKQGVKMSKFNIGRSKEISEDLRKKVVEAHKSGKSYKRIAKELDLHLSTVRQIVYKWKKFSTVATLPRSGRPAKIGAKARCTILKHMRENTRVTAKGLKASLALDNINVHESTIRKSLSKWCSWDFIMEEATALQQE